MEQSQSERFYQKLKEKNLKPNSFLLSTSKINKLLSEVKTAKSALKKKDRDFWLLKHYDVLSVDGTEHLICPLKAKNQGVRYYCSEEKLFDVLHAVHTGIQHGARDRMIPELKKWKNITQKQIKYFLDSCETCQLKRKTTEKGLVVKPIISTFNLFNSRAQIHLIDFQSMPDGEFKFILNYQDQVTKFVILRALRYKTAGEVAMHVLDIFLLMGAPCILQSNNENELCCKDVVEELKGLWPSLKIVYGNASHSENHGSVKAANADVQTMVAAWMKDTQSTQWSIGIKFVQFTINGSFHAGTKRSPYHAMFGQDPRVGLESLNLPQDILSRSSNIIGESELEQILKPQEDVLQVVDAQEGALQMEPIDNIGNNSEAHFNLYIENQSEIQPTIKMELNEEFMDESQVYPTFTIKVEPNDEYPDETNDEHVNETHVDPSLTINHPDQDQHTLIHTTNQSSINDNSSICIENYDDKYGKHFMDLGDSDDQLTRKMTMASKKTHKGDFGCNKTFTQSSNLKSLKRIHTNAMPFKCEHDGCMESFTHAASLRSHQRIHTSQKLYMCDYADCNKAFTQSQNLRIHQLTHTGEKPYKCDFVDCNKAYKHPSDLCVHKRTHTDEKPYTCDYDGCNKGFTHSSNLISHQRIHTGEKPYKCDFVDCNKSFTRTSHLTRHQLTHTGEKPFKCSYDGCHKAYTLSQNLKTHQRTHSGDKPFKCEHSGCDMAFTCLAALKWHKVVHTRK